MHFRVSNFSLLDSNENYMTMKISRITVFYHGHCKKKIRSPQKLKLMTMDLQAARAKRECG